MQSPNSSGAFSPCPENCGNMIHKDHLAQHFSIDNPHKNDICRRLKQCPCGAFFRPSQEQAHIDSCDHLSIDGLAQQRGITVIRSGAAAVVVSVYCRGHDCNGCGAPSLRARNWFRSMNQEADTDLCRICFLRFLHEYSGDPQDPSSSNAVFAKLKFHLPAQPNRPIGTTFVDMRSVLPPMPPHLQHPSGVKVTDNNVQPGLCVSRSSTWKRYGEDKNMGGIITRRGAAPGKVLVRFGKQLWEREFSCGADGEHDLIYDPHSMPEAFTGFSFKPDKNSSGSGPEISVTDCGVLRRHGEPSTLGQPRTIFSDETFTVHQDAFVCHLAVYELKAQHISFGIAGKQHAANKACADQALGTLQIPGSIALALGDGSATLFHDSKPLASWSGLTSEVVVITMAISIEGHLSFDVFAANKSEPEHLSCFLDKQTISGNGWCTAVTMTAPGQRALLRCGGIAQTAQRACYHIYRNRSNETVVDEPVEVASQRKQQKQQQANNTGSGGSSMQSYGSANFTVDSPTQQQQQQNSGNNQILGALLAALKSGGDLEGEFYEPGSEFHFLDLNATGLADRFVLEDDSQTLICRGGPRTGGRRATAVTYEVFRIDEIQFEYSFFLPTAALRSGGAVSFGVIDEQPSPSSLQQFLCGEKEVKNSLALCILPGAKISILHQDKLSDGEQNDSVLAGPSLHITIYINRGKVHFSLNGKKFASLKLLFSTFRGLFRLAVSFDAAGQKGTLMNPRMAMMTAVSMRT